ncbi:MAG: tRNA (adenine-N1)-methyltransferase [Chloroflexi bacterium]|nr:tRNA (adenine-N1)-methyltransferase [Chloroflexota bacterium]
MKFVEPGDQVLLLGSDRKPFFLRAAEGGELQTHHGVVPHLSIIGQPWGKEVRSHLGYAFLILAPSLHDVLLYLRRQSQIIFPKDIGYILLRLSVGPGRTIVEAGTGSGGLTTALAWSVGGQGRVISYDRREDMQNLARQNLERIGLESQVTLKLRDISAGFDETDVDALFLDLPDPHLVLPQARAALRNGAPLGAIVPTANQVSELIEALERNDFGFIEVCEIMLRFYKIIPARFRPVDRMVAHTGYLIFARTLMPGAVPPANDAEEAEPAGDVADTL